MSPGAPRFSSFRCSGEQSRKDKGPGCCPKPPQSATPYVHTLLAAITLFGEEPFFEPGAASFWRSRAYTCAGSRAFITAAVAREAELPAVFPRTAENNCGMDSLA